MPHKLRIEQAWEFLLKNLRNGAWLLDADGYIVQANSIVEMWLEQKDLTGTHASKWYVEGWPVTEDSSGLELISTSGVVRKVDIATEALLDEKGNVVGHVQMLTDQTMARALEGRLVQEVRRMAKLAGEDALTGLHNRRAFDEALAHMQLEMGRKFGVVVIDLDDFKAVNDSLGHAVGDRVLAAYGERLKHLVRGDDLVARIGGDEFAILLPNVNMVALTEAAERLREDLVVEIEVEGSPFRVYASIGYAHSGPDPSNVVERADKWMYQNKLVRESGGLAKLAEQEHRFEKKTG